MKAALSSVGAVLLVAIGVAVIAGAIFGIRWVVAGPSGKLNAREQILSGSNRIQAYTRFFDLCASVQTSEAALDASYAELPTAKGDDKQRILTNITAQRINRAEAINTYNADAEKTYTVGQFRSLRLPFQLSTGDPTYTKGAHTLCAA